MIRAAAAPDVPGRGGREMRRQDQRVAVGVLLDEAGAGAARQVHVAARAGGPFRLQQLDRVVQHVADEEAAVLAGAGVDHDVAWGVAGRAFEPQPVVERVVVIHQYRLPALDDRQDAVAEGGGVRRRLAALVHPLPVRELAPRHDVLGIGEGRDPAAVAQPRIPADMVPVQVRAHDVIDLFRPDPGGGEVVEKRRAHAVPLRPGRAVLVVADAGVDQDRVARRPDDEAVKAEHELAAHRIDQLRPQQRLVLAQYLRVEIREELGWIESGAAEIRDAADLELADTGWFHRLPLSVCMCRQISRGSSPLSRVFNAYPRRSRESGNPGGREDVRPPWAPASAGATRENYAALALATAGAMTRPRSLAPTSTAAPSWMRPSRICWASGFCNSRWMTRFSGRAP